jgi:hypothetical protein
MIYTIHRDPSHRTSPPHRTSPRPSGARPWDAELIYFDGYRNIGFENPEIDYTNKVPSVVEFVGNLEAMKWSDFPYTDRPYLIMSRKMLDVLLSIQPFKYRIYPTLMYSYEIDELVRSALDGTRTDYHVEDPSLFTEKFIIMQLAETIDVLDEDNIILDSRILKLPGAPEIKNPKETITAAETGLWYFPDSYVKHYEFTREEKDLPPVFTTSKTSYFFTEAAVHALEANNIRGVEFRHIPQQLVKAL